MTTPACHAFQQAVFEAVNGAALLRDRPDLAGHHDACVSCQQWLEAFAQGLEDVHGLATVAAGVAARTVGRPCAQARETSGRAFDEPLAPLDRALVEEHLTVCADCREFGMTLEAVVTALPELAELDPGPAFTARVLAATSRRPARRRAFVWWRRQWETLVSRPRFAIEAAYALTLCLVLVMGNPLSAWEWTVARIEPVARQRLAAGVEALDRTIEQQLGAVRDRLAESDVGLAASEASASLGASWAEWARRTWDDLVSSISAALSRVMSAVDAAAAWARQWARGLLDRAQVATTEPDAGPAR